LNEQQKDRLAQLLELSKQARPALLASMELRPEDAADLQSLLLHADQTIDPLAADALHAGVWQSASAWVQAHPELGHIGQTLGSWKLVELLGQGGMGEVYLAERADGAFVGKAAVKLLPDALLGANALARFRAEQQTLARLQHPGIAQLLDAGVTDDGTPYFVMEWVNGESLNVGVRDLDLSQRLALFIQLCEAVGYAHRNLVIHRDLKPGNVLLTRTGQIKLLDFGIAKVLDIQTDARNTQTQQRIYTPRYAAPEQVQGHSISTATDVYALGMMLFELMTGRLPYGEGDSNSAQLALAAVSANIPKPSSLKQTPLAARWPQFRKQINGDLELVVLKALEKQPEQRYQSVEVLAQDLRNYLTLRPISVRADRRITSVWKFIRRNRSLSAALALSLLSLVSAAIWATLAAQRERAQRTLAEQRAGEAQASIRFINQLFSAIDPATAQGRELTVAEVVGSVLQPDYQAPSDPIVAATVDLSLSRVMSSIGKLEDSLRLAERARRAVTQASTVEPALRASVDLRLLIARYQALDLGVETPEGQRTNGATVESVAAWVDDPALVNPSLGAPEQLEAALFRADLLDQTMQIERAQTALEGLLAQSAIQSDPAALDQVQQAYLQVLAKWRRSSPLQDQIMLERLNRLLGSTPKHPDTVTAYTQLAQSYATRFEFAPALKYDLAALALAREIYPADYPDLSYLRVAAARSHIGMQQFQDAIALLSLAQSQEKREGVLIYVTAWLGYVEMQAGQLSDAERKFRWVLSQAQSDDWWTRLPTEHRLAQVLLRRGDLLEAAKLMQNVEQRAPTAFGADNPRVWEFAVERAELYFAQGDKARIERELPVLIQKFQQRFGRDVQPVAVAQRWLAKAKAMP
jgi:serine/threonine protein kinase/tetratricopeptide (TPR) repeat protein